MAKQKTERVQAAQTSATPAAAGAAAATGGATTVEITVDGRKVQVPAGSTLLQALRGIGIHVPTLCYLEGRTPFGGCRVCVVEVAGRRNLVPSCSEPVQPGMVVSTHSQRVLRGRKTVVELLLANHPEDCLVCERNGNCDLQDLARELGVRERRYRGEKRQARPDLGSPVERDPNKCILCGKCVRVCSEVQGVGAIDFTNRGFRAVVAPALGRTLQEASCVYCGQCVMVCPTGALRERSSLEEVWAAIHDPNRVVVAQVAPAVRVAVDSQFGMPATLESTRRLVAALRQIGFDRVFDTQWSADLTIMEEAHELVERLQAAGAVPGNTDTAGATGPERRPGATGHVGPLPLFTSCSPGWIKYVEHFHPDFLPHLSTCKSPQQMLGAVIKRLYAFEQGINPNRLFVVSIMPCTAKKFEAERPEMQPAGTRDVDAVLTTRELLRMMELAGVSPADQEPMDFDSPLGESTGAGTIFGATGGVAEAALRTAFWMVNGRDLEKVDFPAVRGLEGVKEAVVDLQPGKKGGIQLRCAVVNGLANAGKLLDSIRRGERQYDFVEFMACPGGCIGGGGQPRPANVEELKRRMAGLYALDQESAIRVSHRNPTVVELYRRHLGQPGSEAAHKLLHTRYTARPGLAEQLLAQAQEQ
ncbi:MAG: (2Fe-2S)-binding protein [Firmicutes bacterium]|nr:(2Fe-2S)-binding protein [Bacillota bacterium]